VVSSGSSETMLVVNKWLLPPHYPLLTQTTPWGLLASMKDRIGSYFGRRQLMRYLMIFMAVTALVFLGRQFAGHIPAIENWLATLGFWAPVGFVLIYVILTPLFIPMSLLAVPAGTLFGLLPGTALVFTGTMIASALMFLLAQGLMRQRVQLYLTDHPRIALLDRTVVRGGFKLMLLLRLTPVNFAIWNYILGASRVDFKRFMLACLGMLPGNILPVYLGYLAGNLVRHEGGDPQTVLQRIATYGGLVAMIMVMGLVARMARRILREESGEETPLCSAPAKQSTRVD
jgi:uncharacterized membrane protein YdjX (TVP38/TMEM64 family)